MAKKKEDKKKKGDLGIEFPQRSKEGLGKEKLKSEKKAADRKKIREEKNWEKQIIPILYRPFDRQWIFYNDAVIERTRKDVMRHMMQENLALCVGRAGQVVGLEKPWNVVFCAECIEDLNLFYRGGNVNFPLYVYPY